jgi:hypothetical protein
MKEDSIMNVIETYVVFNLLIFGILEIYHVSNNKITRLELIIGIFFPVCIALVIIENRIVYYTLKLFRYIINTKIFKYLLQ